MKERNHAFDLLCGLCIVRMVTLHTIGMCGHADDGWWLEVMQWTYYFMSFFFFKAGYFNKGVDSPFSVFLKDKAKRLFIPYLTCGLIGTVCYFGFYPFLVSHYKHFTEPFEWEHLWMQSSFYGNNPTWFLFSFFCMYIFVHVLEHLFDRVHPYARCAYALFPLASWWLWSQGNPVWMQLNNLFMGVYLFQLGKVWHIVMNRMSRGVTLSASLLLVAFFVVSNILFHDSSYTMSSNTFTGQPLITILNMSAVLCGLSGLLITWQVPRIPVLSYIGEHSMFYFVGHYPMLYVYKLVHLSFGRSIYGRYDEFIIVLPVIFCLCTWLVPYIERIPWLSGRWPKEKIIDKQEENIILSV